MEGYDMMHDALSHDALSRSNMSDHVSRLETKRFAMTMHDALSHDVLLSSNTSGHASLLLTHPKTGEKNVLSDQ